VSRGWKIAQSAYTSGRRWMGPAFPLVRASARLGVRVLSRVTRFELPADQPYSYRFLTNLHEPGTTLVVKRALRPGMVAVDVGAHVGYFTRLFAKLVGSGGRVFAFEPHPALFAVLERNTRGYANASLFNCAVSDRMMRASLYESRNSGGHSLFPASTRGAFIGVRNVEIVSLGDVLGDQKVDLVKIDVEGAEIEVVNGMRPLMTTSSAPSLIVECNPSTLSARGSSERVLFEAISQMGYEIEAIHEEARGLMAVPDVRVLTEMLRGGPKYINLYCTRR